MEFTCGVCQREEMVGSLVCTNCGGTVIYGATSEERKIGAIGGLIVGTVAYMQVGRFLGLSGSFTALAVCALIGMGLGVFIVVKLQQGKIRTRHHAVGNR